MVGPTYSVRVGVGSGDTQHFYRLAVDMVGNLTWMQCLPSNPKLKQDAPIFDPKTSHRYKNVGHDDPLCKAPFTPRPTEHRCGFNIRFRAEAMATGYLGKDEFAFGAGSGSRTTNVDGLVFGCAHRINGWNNKDVLAGIPSLNRRPTSFVRQLSTHGGGGARFSYCLLSVHGGGTTPRFSYCLVDHKKYPNKHGFLRFGADVPDHSHAQSTALLYGEPDGGFGMYYVRLVGVSVAGRKLTGITPKMFQRDRRSRLGGCYVDVGNPTTRFAEAPYDILEAGVAAHMASHGLHRTPVPGHRLCVRGTSPEVMPKLPSITLHFAEDEAAGLEIKSRLLFATVKHAGADYVCFIVQRAPVTTVIGGHQQVDTRFTFDLEENRLFFAPEDCHGDAS
ncbi:hypothetical protein BRADI_1g18295v3 [Brachypodium distachyon]|uniref:Peptidase A1 domain-containing protein n=1 Tax=Brachypodium distachyon TaxID=15368 RepID=A0A0Q3GUQ1_BRADI|nr:hypothetical protein BRADI_1g18295v3 [Brachypodium distachyon]